MKDVKEKLEELYEIAVEIKDVSAGMNVVNCQIDVEFKEAEAKKGD